MYSVDISTATDNLNTFIVQCYELNTPKINAMATIEGWLDSFGNVLDILKHPTDATLSAMKNIGGITVDVVKSIFGPESFGDYYKEAINNITKIMSVTSEEGDNGIFNNGTISASWKINNPINLNDTTTHIFDTDEYSVEEMILRKAPAYMALKATSSGVAGMVEKSASLAFEASKRAGSAIDPNIITVYNGTSMREFTFVINIIPPTREYAKTLKEAILSLKYYMTGSRDKENLYVQQKHCFMVKFENDKINNYLGLKYPDGTFVELNLNRINLDMGVDGSMGMFQAGKDSVPKTMQLTLVFQERRPLRKNTNNLLDNTTQQKQDKKDKTINNKYNETNGKFFGGAGYTLRSWIDKNVTKTSNPSKSILPTNNGTTCSW